MNLAVSSASLTKPSSNHPQLLLHFALVCAAQAAYAFAYSRSPALRGGIVLPLGFRLAAWTAPAVLVLLLRGINPLDYLKLRGSVLKGVLRGSVIGLVIIAANLIGARMFHGRWHVNWDLQLNVWLCPILLVGLSEEVLFRGYFLQRFVERMTFLQANFAQASLFLLIHFPGWLILGQLKSPASVGMVFYVFGLGLFLGVIQKKTNSLWSCMIIHSCSNFSNLAL